MPRPRSAAEARWLSRVQRDSDADSDADGLQPILTAREAAALLRISLSTLYKHVSEGRYASAVIRGRPLRFLRDELIACVRAERR